MYCVRDNMGHSLSSIRCDKIIFEHGKLHAVISPDQCNSAEADELCAGLRNEHGKIYDWHRVAGRIVIKCMSEELYNIISEKSKSNEPESKIFSRKNTQAIK